MPVPRDVTTKDEVHIFQYSSDLKDACSALKNRLQVLGGCTVPLTTINTMVVYTDPFGGDTPEQNKTIAWLVGHGQSSDAKIGTRCQRDKAYLIGDIMRWLADRNYRVVVDTCCQPNQRLRVVKSLNLTHIGYYCAPNGQNVSENQEHGDLHDWWDKNIMNRTF
jgi:hypothetical protein